MALEDPAHRLSELRTRLASRAENAGLSPPVLLAVSKTRTAGEVRGLHAAGQTAFGENYVQEALEKIDALAGLPLQWHLIGHLQSNKAKEAAERFDWVQSVDRIKLVDALARHRPANLPPLAVLVQVNIDGEAGKHGCTPAEAAMLCEAIAARPTLALRGLMAIPAPDGDMAVRGAAFRDMRRLFDALRARFPQMDTLSMGMSEDAELAVAEGSTMVRIGTALFGPRAAKTPDALS